MQSNSSYTPSELAVSLKNDDRKAYEFFYDQYAPAMFGIICRLVPKEDDARTVMTEAFLEFRRKMIRGERNEFFFLLALNISRNMARQFLENGLIDSSRRTNG